MKATEILVRSTLDGTLQPSLFCRAEGKHRPLLVVAHTWSWDRFNQLEAMLPYAKKHDFHLLLPEFRGPNLESNEHCTEACGSPLAKQDIKDAIDHVLLCEDVDADNIFLLGLSGGGHMSLLMAGYCPTAFKAVAAFVPITDLEKWAKQSPGYGKHVNACCSGSVEEMRLRSPMTYIDRIAESNLKIFHGKDDPIVPVSHSLELYGELIKRHPHARVYLDIFDGGHEIDMVTAMHWLLSQYKGKEMGQVTG